MPKVCFGCNAHLYGGEKLICTVCRNDLPLTDYNFNEENAVDRTFYGRINIKKASSFLYFIENGIVKKLIHQLKYRNQEKIGTFLGEWYGQILKVDKALEKIDYVIPVPLHKTKLRKRGFNQVDKFGESIAFHINAQYLSKGLTKTANTKTQTKKGRLGRIQTNKELYTLSNPEILKNKKVLLIDDVITTGATMEICANTLLKIEGITLYIASMAIVPLD